MEQIPKTYTMVRIETRDPAGLRSQAHIQTSDCNLDIEALGQLVRQALLGMGYHWDNVRELFGEEVG